MEIPADLRNKLLLQDKWAWKTCLKSLRRKLEMSKTFTRTLAGKAKRIRAAIGAGWSFFFFSGKNLSLKASGDFPDYRMRGSASPPGKKLN